MAAAQPELLDVGDIRLTMNTYSHVTQQLHDVAGAQMDAVMFGQKK
jgi:hypothetical protein